MNTDFHGWEFERERESRKKPEEPGKGEKLWKSFQANAEDRGIVYRRDPEGPAEDRESFTTEYHGFHGHGQSPLGFPRDAVFSRYTRLTSQVPLDGCPMF
jgi:hypothetical protein